MSYYYYYYYYYYYVTLDCCYLCGLLLTTATSSVVSVRVVPEYLNEAIVEKRLTASVCSTCLRVACKLYECCFGVSVVTNLHQQKQHTDADWITVEIVVDCIVRYSKIIYWVLTAERGRKRERHPFTQQSVGSLPPILHLASSEQ